MEKLTHFKKMNNPNYLGSYSLATGENEKGEPTYSELVVEIEKVVNENVIDPATRKEEQCVVAYLKGNKPMILNATNQKMIADVVGSPYIERWAGKKITLYVAKVKAFGSIHDALRVRSEPPKKASSSNPRVDVTDKSALEKMKVALSSGAWTLNKLKEKYDLTEAAINELTK